VLVQSVKLALALVVLEDDEEDEAVPVFYQAQYTYAVSFVEPEMVTFL